ncbi:hypothetical protein H7E67_13680 [Clostridium gasigenes]|uniref:hypothetical protein n=1 Tax=Clostridium gasigenes TaxID=94869 RepID=UPI001623BADC|nr:hypothetical protein [Clostridium gasigenes]MBB6624488.1 hypothetical protein [Clostridium gasigenes]
MIKWELKKLIKSKSTLMSLGVLCLVLIISIFIKPTLETENNYFDDNKGFVVDSRAGLEIAKEKFQMKVESLEEQANLTDNDKDSKILKSMAEEKIKSIEGTNYEEVGFWQVFTYRATNPLINIGMLVIIMILISNLYTDEIISSVRDIILSSKEKKRALNSKIVIALLIPIVIYSVYLVGVFTITYIQKGSPINGELEAVRIINHISILKGNPTIVENVLRNIAVALLMFEGWAMISMLFSFISTSSIGSISGFGLFIALTKAISAVKILPSTLVLMFSYSNYYDLMFMFNTLIGSYMGSINMFGYNMDLMNLAIVMLGAIFAIAIALSVWVTRTKYINR